MKQDIEINKIITGDEWQEKSYVIIDHAKQMQFIIDPGFHLIDIIDDYIDNEYKMKYILITHAHHDHLGGAEEISKKYDIPCIIHPFDKRIYMHVSMFSMRFANRKIIRPTFVKWVDDNTKQELRQNDIMVIETPGHTSGSCCYLFQNHIFTGDTLLKKQIGRTDLPGSDRSLLKESIDQLMRLDKKDLVIYPGHGDIAEMEEIRTWWQNNRDTAQEHKLFMDK